MSAYTPGPWQYLRSPSGPIRVGPSHNCTVAVAPFPPAGDQEANVRLIAAAPELVEALREAEAALNGIRCTCRCTPWGQVGPAMIRARAALAAAKGERT